MVPEHIVRLSEMPVNRNGKIDLMRLPQFVALAMKSESYVAPATELEMRLCRIWEKILHTGDIGINDDFFELGGDSIKAIQILTLLNAEGIDLKIHDLYQLRTVAQVVRYLGEGLKFADAARANAFFDTKFGEGNVRIFESEHGCILSAAREEFVSEELFKLMNEYLDASIFPVDYVIPVQGEEIETAVMRRLGALRNAVSERELRHFLRTVRSRWKKTRVTITGGAALRAFPLSPIQTAHSKLPYRLCGYSCTFSFAGPAERVSGAVKTLIGEQQLLRCSLKKTLVGPHWIEHEVKEDLTGIPCLDLSSFSEEIRTMVCDCMIRRFIYGRDGFGSGPLYRLFLIRCTPFTYRLYIGADHLIFDVTSAEIIRKRIGDILAGRTDGLRQTYSGYTADLAEGPSGVSEAELADRLNLASLKPVSQKLRSILRNSSAKSVLYSSREQSVGGTLSEQDIWSMSFDYCAALFFELFPFDILPIEIVYHGRKYGSKVYYDQVGEYLDVIPLMLRRDERKPAAFALDTLQYLAAHSVNFAALAFDPLVGVNFPRLRRMLPSSGREMTGTLGFNFEGKFSEQERDSVRRMAFLRLKNKNDAGMRLGTVFFDAMYDEKKLKFSVYYFDPRLRDRIETLMNDTVANPRI